jgi:hypothetical protein
VDHDRALVRIAGSGQYRRFVTTRDGPWLHQHSIGVHASEEAHLSATGFLHVRPNLLRSGG